MVSYNHYKSFPIVKTLKQIQDEFLSYDTYLTKNEINKYTNDKMEYQDNNFVKANSYLVEKSKMISYDKKLDFITNAYLAEVLREGKILQYPEKHNEIAIKKIKETDIYKYSNITQLHSLQKNQEYLEAKYKTKRDERRTLSKEYPHYSTNKKLETIKSIFAASCELPTTKENLFKNTQNIEAQVEKLLSELLYENSDFSLVPKFTPIKDGYELQANHTQDGKAKLYLDDYGKNPEIMYAEFSNKSMLLYIINNADYIRTLDMFKDVFILKFCAPQKSNHIGIKHEDIPNTEFAIFKVWIK